MFNGFFGLIRGKDTGGTSGGEGGDLRSGLRYLGLSAPSAVMLDGAAASAYFGIGGQVDVDKTPNGVSVISIRGATAQNPGLLEQIMGTCSTSEVVLAIRDATLDRSSPAILLDIDSPGGTVAGTSDLVEAMEEAVATKPVYAIAHDCCTSAAYWWASAAKELVATPTAQVGSIAAAGRLIDDAGMLRQMGAAVIDLTGESDKTFGELTQSKVSAVQAQLDELTAAFAERVAANRKLTVQAVRSLRGASIQSRRAVSVGLVDRVVGFAQYLREIDAMYSRRDPARGGANAVGGSGRTIAQARASNASPSPANRPTAAEAAPSLARRPVDQSARVATPAVRASIGPRLASDGKSPATRAEVDSQWSDETEFRNTMTAGGFSLEQVRASWESVYAARAQASGKGPAEAAFLAKVDLVARERKVSHGAVVGEVVKSHPDLHQRYVCEIKGQSPEREVLRKAAAGAFFQAVSKVEEQQGVSRGQAIAAVIREQPDLHRRYVACGAGAP